ncbi:hypothetical protein EO238_31410, partial [Citrobacter sp. AAK_AS5]
MILSPHDASWLERLAAREVRRYVYVRTGRLLPMVSEPGLVQEADTILVARKDRNVVTKVVAGQGTVAASLEALGAQAY